MNLSRERVLLSNYVLENHIYYQRLLHPHPSSVSVHHILLHVTYVFSKVESPSSFKFSGGICSISRLKFCHLSLYFRVFLEVESSGENYD